MSISTTNNRNDYIGNGAVDTYPYGFRIFKKADLRVTKNSGGVESPLTVDVDFTVTGVGAETGGNIVLTAGNLPIDDLLTIRRVLDLKQETDIRNQGDYFAETHEDEFDRGVMVAQQQQDEIDRSVRNPETVPASVFSPQLPADIATPNRALITNSAGNGIILGLTAVDNERIFKTDSYAALKALAIADPTSQRSGWASDIKKKVFYTADLTVGDAGWIVTG